MSQELPEVDVEHVAAGLQHDVVIVAVADSQDVGGHTAAGTRVDEVLHGLDRDKVIDSDPGTPVQTGSNSFFDMEHIYIRG